MKARYDGQVLDMTCESGEDGPMRMRPVTLPEAPTKRATSRAATVCVLVVALVGATGCKGKGASTSPDAGTNVTAAAPTAPPKPVLPPEPAPPVAEKASEVPGLETKLAKDAAYQKLWTAPRADLNVFLTLVSEFLAKSRSGEDIVNAVKAKKLFDAVVNLSVIHARIGKYPADFTQKLEAHLEATKGEPALGTWSAYKKGGPLHDYSGLAAWVKREDAAYLRTSHREE